MMWMMSVLIHCKNHHVKYIISFKRKICSIAFQGQMGPETLAPWLVFQKNLDRQSCSFMFNKWSLKVVLSVILQCHTIDAWFSAFSFSTKLSALSYSVTVYITYVT